MKNENLFQDERETQEAHDIDCRSALQWILTSVSPEHAKIWADRLIDKYGSLANALAGDRYITTELLNGISSPARYLSKLKIIINYSIKCDIRETSIVGDWDHLIRYLQLEMGQLRVEQMRLLLFDNGKCWIGEEIITIGDTDRVTCYPTQVARKAVVAYASGVILVHNHPSGDPKMSREDKMITYAVENSCRAVGVRLYDHMVICRDRFSSFREDNPLWGK